MHNDGNRKKLSFKKSLGEILPFGGNRKRCEVLPVPGTVLMESTETVIHRLGLDARRRTLAGCWLRAHSEWAAICPGHFGGTLG